MTAADQRVARAIADICALRHLVTAAVRLVGPLDVGAVVEPRRVEVAGDDRRWKRDVSHPYSALMPAVLITCAQRSWSFFRKTANSAGLSATVMAPSCFMRACVSGLAS